MTCCSSYSPAFGLCHMGIDCIFHCLCLMEKKRPGSRYNQIGFLLRSISMAQHLYKCLCLIYYSVPLLITGLLSCIFAIEGGNVILIVSGVFCMLYKACNIGLRLAGYKSTKTSHLLNCSFYLLVRILSLQWKIGWSHVEAITQFY